MARPLRGALALPGASLLLPIGLAIALRVPSLSQRGLLYWDEGKFALEGLRLYGLVTGHTLGGKTIGTAKPGHAALIALSYALVGTRDLAPLLLSTVCSVVCVALIYRLGAALFDSVTGLVAATLLAASAYDVTYARSALSEADATLFLLLAALLCARRARPAWAAPLPGLAGGLALSVNYRILVYLAVLWAVDVGLRARREGLPAGLSAASTWAVGVAAVPLAWQLLDFLAQSRGVFLFRSELTGGRMLYLEQIGYQLHEGRQSHLGFQPSAYVSWYVVRQGYLSLLLLLAGLGVAVWKRSSSWLIPSVLVVIPFIVFAFAPVVAPRNLAETMPFCSLIVAALLTRAAAHLSRASFRCVGIVGATVVLAGFGVMHAAPLLGERSGFARAAQYVTAHGGPGVVSTSEVMAFYLRRSHGCGAVAVPTSRAGLGALERDGYRYLVFDHTVDRAQSLLGLVMQTAPQVVHFSLLGTSLPLEDPVVSDNGSPPLAPPSPRQVRVYALAPTRGQERIPGPAPCDPNQVL